MTDAIRQHGVKYSSAQNTTIEEISCEIDDFCKLFFPQFGRGRLPSPNAKRQRALAARCYVSFSMVFITS